VSSRRVREARQTNRLLTIVVSVTLLAAAIGIWYAEPRESDKPLVTVFERPDCHCCHLWAEHMKARGFRVQVGTEAQWPAVRERFGISAKMQACHTAIVDGLFIEGHVPAHDVRMVLQRPDRDGIVGLIVPDMPRGSPGMDSLVRESFTVYALRASGEVRPLFDHHEHEIE
jgi:hypothetical protein